MANYIFYVGLSLAVVLSFLDLVLTIRRADRRVKELEQIKLDRERRTVELLSETDIENAILRDATARGVDISDKSVALFRRDGEVLARIMTDPAEGPTGR